MNRKLISFFLMSFIVSFSASENQEKADWLTLNSNNFDHALKEHQCLAILFHWVKCSDCHRVMPTIDKFAAIVKTNNTAVTVAKIEAVDNRDISNRYNVKTVPVLKFFHKGNFVENYPGNCEENELLRWVDKQCKN